MINTGDLNHRSLESARDQIFSPKRVVDTGLSEISEMPEQIARLLD